MRTFTVVYKQDNKPSRKLQADYMKVDSKGFALFIRDGENKGVVSVVNIDAILEIIEEPS